MGFMNLFKTVLRGHWGVHPADHKRPAADQPIRSLPLPPRLHLMLSQHVGAATRPMMLVGQKVMIPDGREGPVTALSGDLCRVLVYGQKYASLWDYTQLEPVYPRYGR